ncbi:hypothetical protein [Curtobacterium sp. PhB130]|uniref:hypothetical protein n=1 Tax=Curtobacterium sp. PhB130 TaxID=2485178 RepID=UPI0011CE6FA5|nr:hypothetical protein [Curtobacterium sp. PhB130]
MNRAVVDHVVPVQLPRLAGTRHAADHLIEPKLVEVAGATVRLLGQNMIDASSSFSDQLLVRLVDASVGEVVVYSGPDDFFDYLTASAKDLGFKRLRRATPTEEYSV